MPGFQLAHLSDPHLPSPPARLEEWRLKRLLSGIAWRRKRHHHSLECLNRITADIAGSRPDHTVVTGDLTNFSTDREFEAAAVWLRTLGDPKDVTVSPGNHDALVPGMEVARDRLWQRWLGDNRLDDPGAFPFLRRRGPVAIINLSSAVATPPHLAQGRLGSSQIEQLSQVLRETGDAGLCRIVLIHHPVTEGVVSRRKSLTDANALREVLLRAGTELVLHGHGHQSVLTHVPGPNGQIPVLAVPSASAVAGHGEASRWNKIEVQPTGRSFSLSVTARGPDSNGRIGELGRYRLRCSSG